MDVVSFARQILQMHQRMVELSMENERLAEYEDKYNALLNESLSHNQHMTHQLFGLALKISGEIPPNEVHFKDGDKLVGKIVNIGEPS
jgi:hypothetical protein